MKYIMYCLLVIILAGCQSKSDPTMPKASMFSVNVDVPDDLKVTEPFLVNGALVNNSNQTWEIQHGADMFTFDVYDMNGDLTQDVAGIVIAHNLKPTETYGLSDDKNIISLKAANIAAFCIYGIKFLSKPNDKNLIPFPKMTRT